MAITNIILHGCHVWSALHSSVIAFISIPHMQLCQHQQFNKRLNFKCFNSIYSIFLSLANSMLTRPQYDYIQSLFHKVLAKIKNILFVSTFWYWLLCSLLIMMSRILSLTADQALCSVVRIICLQLCMSIAALCVT